MHKKVSELELASIQRQDDFHNLLYSQDISIVRKLKDVTTYTSNLNRSVCQLVVIITHRVQK